MMFSVIILSMLMIVSILTMIRNLPDLWQQLELASELESRIGSGSLILMLEKLNWFRLTGLITQVLLM